MDLGRADGAVLLQDEVAGLNERLAHLHGLLDLLLHLVDFLCLGLELNVLRLLALDELLLFLGCLLLLNDFLLSPSTLDADSQQRKADAFLVCQGKNEMRKKL